MKSSSHAMHLGKIFLFLFGIKVKAHQAGHPGGCLSRGGDFF